MRSERAKGTLGIIARLWVARSLCIFVIVVALLNAAQSCLPEPLAQAWWVATYPGSSAAVSRELEARQLAGRLSSFAPPRTYFIALNLNNNADVMDQLEDQLLVLVDAVGSSRIFVSVWENGSRDDTPLLMARLAAALAARGVQHSVVSDPSPWGQLCAFVDPDTRTSCITRGPSTELRHADLKLRIPVMAAIRNMALLPLYGATDSSQVVGSPVWSSDAAAACAARAVDFPGSAPRTTVRPSTGAAAHLGFVDPTIVVFLNDVLFRAEDVVELVVTEGGEYDLACAMDFGGMKFYDEWVARDLAGQTFSPWFPFVREPLAQARLRAGLPFRVYSCWNGAVAMPATSVRLFRSWREGEEESAVTREGEDSADTSRTAVALQQRSSEPPKASGTRMWSADACPVSECHVFCKDLWSAGLTRVFMNPRVRLVYDAQSRALVSAVLPLAEAFFLSWANRIGAGHHALRSKRIRSPVGRAPTSVRTGAGGLASAEYGSRGAFLPPSRVSCGLSGVDDPEEAEAVL